MLFLKVLRMSVCYAVNTLTEHKNTKSLAL